MDISSVIAKAHIPQADAAALKVGDKGTMTVPGMDEPMKGKVTIISPALDPDSTTVEVWFEAKNPKHALKPGTSVQLSSDGANREGCLGGSEQLRDHRARWIDDGDGGRLRRARSSDGRQARYSQWR